MSMNENQTGMDYSKSYSILAAVMVGNIMGPIDASIVNVVLPTIAQHFGVSVPTAQWVPMVYLLTIGSLLMFYGRLGDIIGYKKIYLAGLVGFIVASALCGISPSIHWLIIFRTLQGLAAGMSMSMPFAIITAAFPTQERGKALGINAIGISAGLALGPSLGGFLTSLLGWRSVFLINIPIGIAALFWGSSLVPNFKGRPAKIDIPGVFLGCLSLLFILLFVNRFETPTSNFITYLLLIASMTAVIAFLKRESGIPEPMLNLALFRSMTFTLASISSLLNFMAQYIMVFLTPFYLQRVLHFDPVRVGLIMTSFPLAVMAVAPFSGTLSDRIGTSLLAFFGAGLCALSLFLMSRLPASAVPTDVVWRVSVFGLGTGIFQSPNNSAAMGSAPRQHLGIASGFLSTVRTIGMVMGIATGGAVLSAFVSPSVLQKASLHSAESDIFVTGLGYAYMTGGALTGIAAVTSIVRRKDRK
jgi:EmrB/QacA subfamily drug resistance transporter